MKRKLIALVCALGLLIPTALADGTSYLDVPEWEWYADVVAEMTEKGIMTGTKEGYFSPNSTVTRAMAVTVLWRLEGCPQPEDLNSFTDIDPDDPEVYWYAPQAAWAKEAGIANGYTDGSFRGNKKVTREQMASFIYQYAKYKGQPLAQGSLGLFDDAYKVSDWAVDAVKHAVGMGILQGNAHGELAPQSKTTRAALATMLHRMMIEAVG